MNIDIRYLIFFLIISSFKVPSHYTLDIYTYYGQENPVIDF